ncbi:Proline--tRNA ligase [Anaplasma phagocytophilum]|nr:Proline--tRNA ligase [Anaplasma phagocytophilum]
MLSRMDLIGLSWQVIVENSFVKSGTLELKNRATGAIELLVIHYVVSSMILGIGVDLVCKDTSFNCEIL